MARNTRHRWFPLDRINLQRASHSRPIRGNRSRRLLRIESLENRSLLSITVDTLVDEADGSIIDGDVSLRDAIALAPASATIDFAPALTGGGPATINLTLGELSISKSLAISGPGANLLTIDASGSDLTPNQNNGDGSRVFNVDDGTNALRTVSISGLTLTGGDVSGEGGGILSKEALTVASCDITGNLGIAAGGGIHNDSGTLFVTASTIRGNSSWSNGGGINSRGNTTVTGSMISENESRNAGGGIWHSGGTLAVTDSNVDRNVTSGARVTKGGGIYSGANLALSRSTITGNVAGNFAYLYVGSGGYGGGVYATGSLTISESTISGNIASYAWDWRSEWGFVEHFGGNGGGVCHTHGSATILRSQISNNQSRWAGGGIAHFNGSLSVADSTISGNRGDFQGGGIYSISHSAVRSNTSLSINRSTISNNSTGSYGGGIWSNGGHLAISSCTISGNVALTRSNNGSRTLGYSGGVYSDNLSSTVSHSTITQNSAGIGGGGIRSLASMAISHSIVAGNTRGEVPAPDDVSGSVEVSLSLLGVSTGATINDKGGNLIGAAGAPIDPLLGPLADNGGLTRTHALLPGSPAIDAVDPTAVTDIAGNVVSANLGSSAYSASQWAQWFPGAAPQFAFDGIVAAGWDAGNYPTPVQWIEVDLRNQQTLTGFRLYVDQTPNGHTTHEIWVSNSPIQNSLSGATLVHTFSGLTADQDVLALQLPSGVAARYVQIRTTESRSWVGWDEVQVFAGDLPRYDQRGAPFGRGFGNRSDMGAFESQPNPPAVFGDYNGDNFVDAADYSVWRDTMGRQAGNYVGADGSGNGIVDEADYAVWRSHFGMTLPSSAGSASIVAPVRPSPQSVQILPAASAVEHAEPDRRANFEQAGVSERRAASISLDSRSPLSAHRHLPKRLRSPIAAVSTESGAIDSRQLLAAAYSEPVVTDQPATQSSQTRRAAKFTGDESLSSRIQALDLAFSTLEHTDRRLKRHLPKQIITTPTGAFV